VKFVVDEVTLGQVFLCELRFPPDSFIPPMLLTHLHIRITHMRRKSGRRPGTNALWDVGGAWYMKVFSPHFFSVGTTTPAMVRLST
jgi:hypothetical protein